MSYRRKEYYHVSSYDYDASERDEEPEEPEPYDDVDYDRVANDYEKTIGLR